MLFWALFLHPSLSTAQGRPEIDSLNHLPFEQKIKNPKRMLPLFLDCAEKAKQDGYTLGEMEAYENISLLYYYLGKYDLELEYATRSIQGFEQLGDENKVARFYGELGYRMKRHDMTQAEIYMRKGIHLAESQSLHEPLMGLWDNYGVLKEMQGQYDSAYLFYNKGLTLKKQHNDRSGLPYSLNNLGGLMLLQNKHAEAKPYFTEALSLRSELGDTAGMCETYLLLSDVDMAQQNTDSALIRLGFVIDHASRNGFLYILANAHQKRALIHEKMGNPVLALADERLSRQAQDSLSEQSMKDKLADLQVQFDTQETEKDLLTERLRSSAFKNWIWILGLSCLIVFLAAITIQTRRKSERRRLELQRLKDLEFERMRISRDLHDNIGAELTLITSKLDIKAASAKLQDEQAELQDLASLSRDASVLLRETIWSIRQDSITKGDLTEKMLQFAQKRAPDDLAIEVLWECEPSEPLVSAHALHLYRIAQESINNAIKYARPTRIQIRFGPHHLEISDNGQGFDTQNYRPGYGIQNMRQRAEEMGATFHLQSDAKGTRIRMEGV